MGWKVTDTIDKNMIAVPLEVLPSQSLTIRLNDDRYEIRLVTIAENLMAISITRNDELLVQSQRIVPYVLLLPAHKAQGAGNFTFYTPDDTYPFYEEFNNGHVLYFVPEDDS